MEFSSVQQENVVCNMESSPDHWLQVEECASAEMGIVDCSISSSSASVILMDERQRKMVRPHHEQGVKCPRCDSTHTKFCYYNNYSLSQPRYFCKTCRRYWTKGGTLRNIPVGGASRKTKKPSNKPNNVNTHHHDLDQHATTTSFFPPLHIDHATTTTNTNHVVDVNTIINAQLSSSVAPHFNHYYNVMESYGGDPIGIMNNSDDDVKPNPNLLMSLDHQWHQHLPPNSSYHHHAYDEAFAGKLHPLFPYFNINNAALGLGSSSCSTTYYGSSTPNSFL